MNINFFKGTRRVSFVGMANNINRTVTGNYVEDSRTNVLNRYFMLTFTYRLKNFG